MGNRLRTDRKVSGIHGQASRWCNLFYSETSPGHGGCCSYFRALVVCPAVGFVFGFEAADYIVTEDSGSVEVCVEQKSGPAISSPVTISVCTSRGDAIGNYLQSYSA